MKRQGILLILGHTIFTIPGLFKLHQSITTKLIFFPYYVIVSSFSGCPIVMIMMVMIMVIIIMMIIIMMVIIMMVIIMVIIIMVIIIMVIIIMVIVIIIINSIVSTRFSSGTPMHVLRSSHNDSRIDVIGSSGNLAVSYTEKTIEVWDVKEGKQKASLTADKVEHF